MGASRLQSSVIQSGPLATWSRQFPARTGRVSSFLVHTVSKKSGEPSLAMSAQAPGTALGIASGPAGARGHVLATLPTVPSTHVPFSTGIWFVCSAPQVTLMYGSRRPSFGKHTAAGVGPLLIVFTQVVVTNSLSGNGVATTTHWGDGRSE